MKKLLVAMGLVLACQLTAYADPEIENHVPTLFEKGKALVEASDPRGGVFFNLKNKTIQGYTSGKLLTKYIRGYELNGTLGYGVDQTLVAGLEADVLGAISNFTGATLEVPWFKVNAGFVGGWSFEDQLLAYGPVVDCSVKW